VTKDQLLSIVEDASVTAVVVDAVKRFPFAEDVFYAAMWRIARDFNCGEVVEDTDPVRRLLFLRPNKVAKSPGLLVKYYEGVDQENYPIILLEWAHYFDYDEAQAATPRAYVANG